LELDEIAALLARVHAERGGATVALDEGDLEGRQGFAVSPYPDRERTYPGRVPPHSVLMAFLSENQDLLSSAGHALGTWFDTEQGITYLT
jgi:hypothetical protein